jgi:hypothetical protein
VGQWPYFGNSVIWYFKHGSPSADPVIFCYFSVILQVSGDSGAVLDFLMDPQAATSATSQQHPRLKSTPTNIEEPAFFTAIVGLTIPCTTAYNVPFLLL